MNLSPARQRLAVIGLMLFWCLALIAYRIYLAANFLEFSLLWNLFLAVLPLFWSAALQAANARRSPLWCGFFFLLWLLFLPNAPYILTDLIHLSPRPNVPLWYILALLLSCAGTGTLLGYLSLLNVHAVVEQRFGKTAGWSVAASSLMLCGFGIYLGRFLRWNSWDAFTRPFALFHSVLSQLTDSGSHPRPLAVTLVFGIGLIIGYLAIRVIAVASRDN